MNTLLGESVIIDSLLLCSLFFFVVGSSRCSFSLEVSTENDERKCKPNQSNGCSIIYAGYAIIAQEIFTVEYESTLRFKISSIRFK
jgi:hypothetical protein